MDFKLSYLDQNRYKWLKKSDLYKSLKHEYEEEYEEEDKNEDQ